MTTGTGYASQNVNVGYRIRVPIKIVISGYDMTATINAFRIWSTQVNYQFYVDTAEGSVITLVNPTGSGGEIHGTLDETVPGYSILGIGSYKWALDVMNTNRQVQWRVQGNWRILDPVGNVGTGPGPGSPITVTLGDGTQITVAINGIPFLGGLEDVVLTNPPMERYSPSRVPQVIGSMRQLGRIVGEVLGLQDPMWRSTRY